jgi:hypothetical protein
MRTEVFNRSKYRDGSAPGDDVPLVIPGAVYGVFDGATDPRGTLVDGMAAGRLAALSVATELATLAIDASAKSMPGKDIIRHVSKALKTRTDPYNLPIPPSTTLAAAIDCGETWRFLLLGDSGVRINQTEVHRCEKIIDRVSTVARVAVFQSLLSKDADTDRVEMAARNCIFLGFENAVAAGLMSRVGADKVIEETLEETQLDSISDLIAEFLQGGIQTQHRFGNATGNMLCFDTLNGAMPHLGELSEFERKKTDVTSIELFTDGYACLPDRATAQAWEGAFQAVEEQDFHKTGQFATVKGSTSTEFFDDRTVVILS